MTLPLRRASAPWQKVPFDLSGSAVDMLANSANIVQELEVLRLQKFFKVKPAPVRVAGGHVHFDIKDGYALANLFAPKHLDRPLRDFLDFLCFRFCGFEVYHFTSFLLASSVTAKRSDAPKRVSAYGIYSAKSSLFKT